MRGKRHSTLRRLISAVAGVVLVCASAIGTHAHVLGHHHTYSQAVQHADHAKPASAEKGEVHEHVKAGPTGKIADHTGCNDFLCHGGYAIVGSSEPVPPRLRSELPVRPMWFAADTQLHSLERPPKSPVLA